MQRQKRLLAMEERDREEQLAIQQAREEAFACRRCPAKFASNSKLHKHVAERHTKKTSSPSSPTSPQASQSIVELAAVNLPTAPLPTPPASTPSATPKLSYTEVAKSALPTPPASPQPTKQISYAKLAESNTKSTPPPIPWHTKPKACTLPRTYMTMEDLFRKFSIPITTTPPNELRPKSSKRHTKAAKPKKASPTKSGCGSKTPFLIKLARPCKVAPLTKVATSSATYHHPPTLTPQQVKSTPPTWPSGVVSQHEAIQHPHLTAPIWEWTRQYGLRLRAWVMV